MAHRNETRIRETFTAFMRGDLEPARSLFDPQVSTHVYRHGPAPGDLVGLDGFLAWGAKLSDLTGGTFREDLRKGVADDTTAFQGAVFRATRRGRSIEDQSVNVYRFHRGRIVETWVFFGNPSGFDDFWEGSPAVRPPGS
jgi:ketosteroid isomerase-like protein